jgi:hypothetical protein
MFENLKGRPSLVKTGFALLGVVWTVPVILGRVVNLLPETPEQFEGQEFQFAFGYYLTLFAAIAILIICLRFFYKNYFQ